MPGRSKRYFSHRAAAAGASRDQEIYDSHAAALYRQALLTLDDAHLAEQVVGDVIIEECLRTAPSWADEEAVRIRLAVSAYRHCRELTGGPARSDPPDQPMRPDQPTRPGQADHPTRPGQADQPGQPGRQLGGTEQGALGLVLFGGLGYVRASRELGISAADTAVLLRAALLRMTSLAAGRRENAGRREAAGRRENAGRRETAGIPVR